MDPQYSFETDNDGDRSSNDTMMESQTRQPLDRLHISLPQAPPRLPAPPTFAMNALHVHASNQKHVQFRDARVVSFIKPGSSMSIEERNELWYPNSDLDGFKIEARTLCRKLREPPMGVPGAAAATAAAAGMEAPCTMNFQENCASKRNSTLQFQTKPPTPHNSCPYAGELIISEDKNQNDNDDDDDEQHDEEHNGETRGLEHRVCINRQRHKHLAIRCTLKAQSRSRCPEFIARISSQCSQWARDLAIKEANRDYCEAYCPHKLSPKILTNESPFPVPIRQTKRCFDGEGPACPSMNMEVQPPIADITAVDEGISTTPFACPSQRQRESQEEMTCMDRCVRRRRDAEPEK